MHTAFCVRWAYTFSTNNNNDNSNNNINNNNNNNDTIIIIYTHMPLYAKSTAPYDITGKNQARQKTKCTYGNAIS